MGSGSLLFRLAYRVIRPMAAKSSADLVRAGVRRPLLGAGRAGAALPLSSLPPAAAPLAVSCLLELLVRAALICARDPESSTDLLRGGTRLPRRGAAARGGLAAVVASSGSIVVEPAEASMVLSSSDMMINELINKLTN